jgi:methylated-DNA-[protein]-cysteine S-methyltransferase
MLAIQAIIKHELAMRILNKKNQLKVKPLWVEMLPTPMCPLWLCFSDKGLQAVYFNNPGDDAGPVWPVGQHQNDPELATHLRQWRQETAAAFKAYFVGEPGSFVHLTLDIQGTPFQIQVWQKLRQTPFGVITSYQALADSLGQPRSARAIGGAMRANPLPIIIPCHRVIATSGSLGGYASGLQLKRQLLSHEQMASGKNPIPLHGPLERQ